MEQLFAASNGTGLMIGDQQLQYTNPTAILVHLQYGSHREKLILERSERPEAFADFFRKAQQLVERTIEEGLTPWSDVSGELLLFRHDYGSMNMLQRLTNLVELDNGSVVEIIRVGASDQQQVNVPHNVHVTNYKAPTFCDYCGEFLLGLIKQGVKCTLCNCNFHKKCAYAARNNCAKNETAPIQQQQQSTPTPASSTDGRKFSYELPHTLSIHNYTTPTVCKVCDKLLMGIIKQGMRCRDCKVNVHRKCAVLLPKDCRVAENGIVPLMEQMSVVEPGAIPLQEMGSIMDFEGSNQSQLDMIPLARLPGSATTSRSSQFAGALCEGWVIYFLLDEPQRRFKQYWILDAGLISIYNEYNNGVNHCRVFKKIPLAEIMSIQPHEGKAIDARYSPHCFEIRTRGCNPNSPITYCVGENLHVVAANSSSATTQKPPRHANSNWQLWYKALQQALQPPSFRNDPLNAEPALQFTQLYQIVREKILGSGQFGTVFHGIHRQTNREVAVKVIAKDRFSKKSTASGVETLKSEVAILHAVDHAGIIKLESMFETKDKIFVVMEKMNGDMLEMILSQATGRLDERSTRFLLMQILNALRYLHSRGIAHCDLKPENVLLSNLQVSFPQTKLCDFGYARFIGDTQFRRTIVGTPAYMAPELLMKKGYNKSLDMWSVGVIIYVTVSGTFPFNDGEEIAEQIQNATFMFPPDLWRDTSPLAIDLVQKLLKVEIEQRLNIDECMLHPFFVQDAQLYKDLRELEIRLNTKYLTTEADDQRFQLPPFSQNLIF